MHQVCNLKFWLVWRIESQLLAFSISTSLLLYEAKMLYRNLNVVGIVQYRLYSGIWKRLRFNYLIMVLNSNIGIVEKESSFRKNCSTTGGQSKLEYVRECNLLDESLV